jgi:hypothetical protein
MPPTEIMLDSAFVTASFFLLVVGIAIAFGVAAWLAGARLGESASQKAAWALFATAVIGAVMAVSARLAASGFLLDYSSVPPRIGVLLAVVTALTIVLASGPFGARFARGLPLVGLVAYQAFRVPLECVLLALGRDGRIPMRMTFEGANFDVLSGLLAIVVAVGLARGRCPRGAVLAWNVLGLGLLANIVTIAVLSMPTRFRVFHEGPANTLVGTFPWVWLPTVLVQAALFGHLAVFRAIREAAAHSATGRH